MLDKLFIIIFENNLKLMKMKTYKFTALSYEAQKLAIHNYMLSSNGLIDDDGVARYHLEDSKNQVYLDNGEIWYESEDYKMKKSV